ncbi:ABC transporter substrate-binding protein [Phyllobacterium sophorae]|uniref:Peptide ABC transporter substrate-binding protein n=1 Tax=Phyllobacterium sophorae TaxID=1520277 RepID=A0A2P7B6L2_9HYPH|nr:ABC transporter substrate-binding protein [Phyllobacterium sophorae]PSH62101.1 peptide ABC transporter substrate-binding protein [Phyllobacterium sophorae]
MLSRRTLTKLALATPLAALTIRYAAAQVGTSSGTAPVAPETRSLDELHKVALAEGGNLIVYGGGDLPNGAAGMEAAFMKRFHGMKIRILIDRSKYQGVRIDNQLSLDRLQCDAVHILAGHYYDRWKAGNHLLPYKPAGWEEVYPDFRDPDATSVAVAVYAFSTLINTNQLSRADAPRDAIDFLNPKLRGKIALTYPQDDDSILYQFDRIVTQHGWEFVDKLMSQDVLWNRGSGVTRQRIEKGERSASFTTSGPLVPNPNQPTAFLLPTTDSFLSWAHPAAIFRRARNPEAAKLYLSWLLSPEIQGARRQWSVRRDMPAPEGLEPIIAYNSYPVHFRDFLRDRGRLEQFRDQLEQYIGPMQGTNPTNVVGIFPEG